MLKTLVYSPEVRVIIEGTDVSADLVRGSVSRRTDSVSTAAIQLVNPGLRYNGRFKRMDRITISLKRTKWIQVFSGYLDSVPLVQLYPGVVQIRASCSLKRLLFTYWDPGLPASQELFDQPSADQQQDGGGSLDAGLGAMLNNVLVKVGNWDEDKIHIEQIPTSFEQYVTENLENLGNEPAVKALKDLFEYDSGTSTGGGGGGGDMGDATFSSIGPPANGSAYSIDEVVAIVKGAGWTGNDIALGASIIMAESGGNPGAVNNNTNGTRDRGLWQINDVHNSKMPDADRFDPAINTQLARMIYMESGGWGPWSTYNNGAYQQYMGQAQDAMGRNPQLPGGSKTKGKDTAVTGGLGGLVGGVGLDTKKELKPLSDADKKKGGIADPAADPNAPDTSGMAVWESIAAVALYKYPMMKVISAYFDRIGPNDDGGYHGKGQACDISNGGDAGTPEMKDLAQWWYDNYFGKGLLELIHSPFNHNVGDDTDVGDGMSTYYDPGTMAQHRNHVHIAMAGRVSADGTTDSGSVALDGSGGGGGGSGVSKLAQNLFNYLFFPEEKYNSGVSSMFAGIRSSINDESLMQTVQSFSKAGMREFQSAPNGDFVAFYPDYFGLDGKKAVLRLEDIEMKNVQIDVNDDALATHVFVKGDLINMGRGSGDAGWLTTHGVATIEDEWLFKRLTEAAVVKPETTDVAEIFGRYGLRPYKETFDVVKDPKAEFLIACHVFMKQWAKQYSTSVEFTFMPELFPGMRVELVGHNMTVYVESVTHSFDLSSGFTTSASISAPTSSIGASTRIDGSPKQDPDQVKSEYGVSEEALGRDL